MTFNELIKLMHSRGFSSLADIARELDVSPQSVSNWKARNQVPYKYVVYIQNKYNIDNNIRYAEDVNTISDENMYTQYVDISKDQGNKKKGVHSLIRDDKIASQVHHPFETDTTLMDIFLILARHLKLIIITPVILCIITIIYVQYFSSPLYVSTAKFLASSPVGGSENVPSRLLGLASQFGVAMPSSNSPTWLYTDIVQSRKLARGMLEHKFDTEKYGPPITLLQILTYGDKEPAIGMDTLIKRGINEVQGMIEINNLQSMYELVITAFEPQLAADVANVVLEELDEHLREYNTRKITETRKFIEERLMDTRMELEYSEEALKNFREKNRNIFSSPALQLEQERLARDVAVLIGVYTVLKQQLETVKINEVKESNYVLILDMPETPLHAAKPKKKQMVILSGFLGIGFGIAFAFIREYAQKMDSKEHDRIRKVKSLIIKNIKDFLPKRFR